MSSFSSHYTKIVWTVWRGHKDDQRAGELVYEERLREMDFYSPERRMLRGDLRTTFQYLKESYKEGRDCLFTWAHMEKMRGNEDKLHVWRFLLDTRGNFFTVRSISHWSCVSRELVDSSTLHMWDSPGQGAGPSCLGCAFTKKDWTRWSLTHIRSQTSPVIPNNNIFNLQHFFFYRDFRSANPPC